jgi:lipopolysaccharide biosynthesis glycosyltransferase
MVREDDNPVVVCAADDAFAMPLAVMVRSVTENLAAAARINLTVLDAGITPANKEKILASWDSQRVAATFLSPETSALRHAKVWGHVNIVSYYRLLIPELMPPEVVKVIYLDCDLLVLADLTRLWREPLGDSYVLAAQDSAGPYMNARVALSNYERCRPYLVETVPLRSYEKLGIPPGARYFNAGVLVMNLRRWREDDITGRALAYLRDYRQLVLWWDQDALNATLAGGWGELDLRWNQTSHLHDYPSWDASPFEEERYRRALAEPWVVHFAAPWKPWHFGCPHPCRDLFFHYLDRTAWRGWRPGRSVRDLRRGVGRLLGRLKRAVQRRFAKES